MRLFGYGEDGGEKWKLEDGRELRSADVSRLRAGRLRASEDRGRGVKVKFLIFCGSHFNGRVMSAEVAPMAF
jgi:hypothetical protein